MKKSAAGRATRKAHLSPELVEVLKMLKALEHTAPTAAKNS